jgi:uncharacterized membrane protein SpoIIM required for sporulation
MFDDYDPAQLLWGAAGLLLLLAMLAALAEHRRNRRRNLDQPGWAPWNLIQILAFMLALAAAALAIRL